MDSIHIEFEENYAYNKQRTKLRFGLKHAICPSDACQKEIIYLTWLENNRDGFKFIQSEELIYPRTTSRNPIPKEVPEEIHSLYEESALVLRHSPRASAALSRRCLEQILSGHLGCKNRHLNAKIDEAIEGGKIPSRLARMLNAVREIGNFAAHPIKSDSSAEVIDVEIGEAETNLDVLEELFDEVFVKPTLQDQKLEELNRKLASAGRKLV